MADDHDGPSRRDSLKGGAAVVTGAGLAQVRAKFVDNRVFPMRGPINTSLFAVSLDGRQIDVEEPHDYPPNPHEEQKTRLEAGIQHYRSACGCELASVFMIGATILFLVYVAYGREEYAVGDTLWRGVMWVLPVTVVGKLLGLTYARVRLHMLRSALRRELQISTIA